MLSGRLLKAWGDADASLHQILDGFHRALEVQPLMRIKLNFDDAFNTLGANHHGNANIKALNPVFAIEVSRARQHALFVFEIKVMFVRHMVLSTALHMS